MGTKNALRQQLMDTLPCAIFYKDRQGRYVACNEAFAAAFNRSTADIIGRTAHDLAPHDLAEIYSAADARALVEQGVVRYEAPVEDAEGSRRATIFLQRRFLDGEGKIAGIAGIGVDIGEHENTERALKESEREFRDVAENALAGIYVVQDGAFKYVNPRFADIHGYRVEEMMEKSPRAVVFPDDLPINDGNLKKMLAGEVESARSEFRIVTREQEVRHIEVYGSFTVYKGRRAVIGTVLDITERKKSEEAVGLYREHLEELIKERTIALEKEVADHKATERSLMESERKYRDMFENATEGVYQVAPGGRCLNMNSAFAKMLGYGTPEEAMGDIADIRDLLCPHPADRDRMLEIIAQKGKVEAYEVEALRKDGGRIWLSVNARAVRGPDGRTGRYEGTIQDVTERKRIEQSHLESEERYRTAIEHSNDGVAMARGSLHLYVNQKFLEMFGYEGVDDIVGDSTRKDVHPDDRERVIGYSLQRMRGEPSPSRYEFKGIRKDGTVIFVEASVAAIVYHGEVVSLAYLRDITERRQMEERLRTLSILDELTGLYNRRGFFTLCEPQLKLAERSGKGPALFFADLDRMKWVNDTFGHQEGDRALLEVAAILRETFRDSDIIGRMGGDEFAILAIDTAGEPETLIARLHNVVDRHNEAEARKYKIALSVGVAAYDPKNPLSLEDLITRADTLMYEEKKRRQGSR